MELINYGLYDWNFETDAIYFSPNLRILLGLPVGRPVDAGGLDASASIRPIGRCSDRRLIEHLKGETPRFSCDVRYRTEDGTWRWARQHGIAFRGPDGRAKRLIGAAGDITEIKQREFELQSAQDPRRNAILPSTALDHDDLESRYALALEFDQRRRRRLRRQSRHRHGLPRPCAGRSSRPAGIRADQRLRRRRPSGRSPASHAG